MDCMYIVLSPNGHQSVLYIAHSPIRSLNHTPSINQSIKKKHIKPNEIYKKLSKRIQWMHVLFIHSYRPPPEANSPSILQK